MKKVIFFLLILLPFLFNCEEDECKETEAAEINFELLISGNVKILDAQGSEITSQFAGHPFVAKIYKYYCNGDTRGPFEEPFSIDNVGDILRQNAGTWSFRMNNTEDRMRILFFEGGYERVSYPIYYKYLAPFDGDVAYLKFKIQTNWDAANSTFYDYTVSLP